MPVRGGLFDAQVHKYSKYRSIGAEFARWLSADGKVPETMRLTCNQCPQIELASVLAICNTYVRMYPAISAIGLVSVHSPYQHLSFSLPAARRSGIGTQFKLFCDLIIELFYILKCGF